MGDRPQDIFKMFNLNLNPPIFDNIIFFVYNKLMTKEKLMDLEKKHIWHPCSQMKDYEEYPATPIVKAQGVWLETIDGKKILDAISSWWVNIFGHCNPYISQKISEQLNTLEHVIFANYTHKPAIILGKRLSSLFNDQLPRVFYADNGSSAIEVAIKMSYHYWYNKNKKEKNLFGYITGAYHGETLGALSVGDLSLYKETYSPLLINTIHLQGPDCFRCPYNLKREECNAECFEKSQKSIEVNKKNMAAIIIEPIVQCANGMSIYPPIFLKKLREYTTNNEIHLICDEIAVGFGRTGKMMATHHANIIPDFVVVSKALTGGFLPLSAVLTTEEVYNTFYGPYIERKAFLHSHSYTGNPLACSAACAVFEIFEKENVLEMVNYKGKLIYNSVIELADYKYVGEIRNIGIITAIELVKDKKNKTQFDWQERIGYKIYREAEKNGVLLRNLGDIIYFMPPYVINEDEINFMTKIAKDAILKILK